MNNIVSKMVELRFIEQMSITKYTSKLLQHYNKERIQLLGVGTINTIVLIKINRSCHAFLLNMFLNKSTISITVKRFIKFIKVSIWSEKLRIYKVASNFIFLQVLHLYSNARYIL